MLSELIFVKIKDQEYIMIEKYFYSLEDLAKWAVSNKIDTISLDAHKCLSVNGAVRYGLTCIAKGASKEKYIDGRYNTYKHSDPSSMDKEASDIEKKLRSYGIAVDRFTLPV